MFTLPECPGIAAKYQGSLGYAMSWYVKKLVPPTHSSQGTIQQVDERRCTGVFWKNETTTNQRGQWKSNSLPPTFIG